MYAYLMFFIKMSIQAIHYDFVMSHVFMSTAHHSLLGTVQYLSVGWEFDFFGGRNYDNPLKFSDASKEGENFGLSKFSEFLGKIN